MHILTPDRCETFIFDGCPSHIYKLKLVRYLWRIKQPYMIYHQVQYGSFRFREKEDGDLPILLIFILMFYARHFAPH